MRRYGVDAGRRAGDSQRTDSGRCRCDHRMRRGRGRLDTGSQAHPAEYRRCHRPRNLVSRRRAATTSRRWCVVESAPVDREELRSILERELARCSAELRAFFARIAIAAVRWRQSPWGDSSGGFWAVATYEGQVLWYNDIEDGFNVSRFITAGEIPRDQYWCNEDHLCVALSGLMRRHQRR